MDNYIDRDMIFKENSAASGNKVKKKTLPKKDGFKFKNASFVTIFF